MSCHLPRVIYYHLFRMAFSEINGLIADCVTVLDWPLGYVHAKHRPIGDADEIVMGISHMEWSVKVITHHRNARFDNFCSGSWLE